MTDSISVWPPGFRVTDSADLPILGATIEFYDAGTSNAMTVYSDSGLTASLGPVVYCDSEGSPVAASGSSTKVPVFVGASSYKIAIKDGTGTTIETKDNLSGAIDTAPFEAGTIATPTYPIISKSVDYTVTAAERGKIINVDPTGGDVTITLLSAVTGGDGWATTIRHVGTANKVIVQTVASQTISIPLANGAAAAFEMVSYGESITPASDGSDWHVISQVLGLKLGSGFHTEVFDAGTQSGGTFTPDPEEGNYQKLRNAAAFTLAPPAQNTSMVLQLTNNGTAGTITTSGFTKVSGDPITTSSGDDFFFNITVVDGFSRLLVEALQ